jgi:hypothetical protein
VDDCARFLSSGGKEILLNWIRDVQDIKDNVPPRDDLIHYIEDLVNIISMVDWTTQEMFESRLYKVREANHFSAFIHRSNHQ